MVADHHDRTWNVRSYDFFPDKPINFEVRSRACRRGGGMAQEQPDEESEPGPYSEDTSIPL